MKLKFNLLLALLPLLIANTPIIVSYEGTKEDALKARETMTKEFMIPAELITLKNEQGGCKPQKALLHLCLNKELKMRVLTYKQEEFLKTFQVFYLDKVMKEEMSE